MKKIQITESDIQEMVFEGLKKILKESSFGNQNKVVEIDWDEIFERDKEGYVIETLDNTLFMKSSDESALMVNISYHMDEGGYNDMSPESDVYYTPKLINFSIVNKNLLELMSVDEKLKSIINNSLNEYLNNLDETGYLGDLLGIENYDSDEAYTDNMD